MNILIEFRLSINFIQVAVGTNYFFEIAIRALRLLFNLVAKEYNRLRMPSFSFSYKTQQNLYDYNVNMLRTTTECMSAIIGEPMQSQIYHTILCIIKTMNLENRQKSIVSSEKTKAILTK
jgi:methylmalonyl-CoA mutase N-terminal domain/subunit